jgi:hypothetical protein
MISFTYTYRDATYKVEGVPSISDEHLTWSGEICLLPNDMEDEDAFDEALLRLFARMNFTVNLSNGHFNWIDEFPCDFHYLDNESNVAAELQKQKETFERAFTTQVEIE